MENSIIEKIAYIMNETGGERKKNKEYEQALNKCENMYQMLKEELNDKLKKQLNELDFDLHLLGGFQYDEGYSEGFKTAFKLIFEAIS